MIDLWQECNGKKFIKTINTQAWRIVEDQSKNSTRKLVSTSQEHEILEKMLEDTKPKLSADLKQLHYLLSTPFRYQPLTHGSRFGKSYERNIFYAAIELNTALTEKAYYRLAFIRAYNENFKGNNINFTSFNVNIKTEQGIDLTKSPFDKYTNDISSPVSYEVSQNLGSSMRNQEIEAFMYFSARTRQSCKNIAVFSPKVFENNQDIDQTFIGWNCFATNDVIEFTQSLSNDSPIIFHASDFFVNGEFPGLLS